MSLWRRRLPALIVVVPALTHLLLLVPWGPGSTAGPSPRLPGAPAAAESEADAGPGDGSAHASRPADPSARDRGGSELGDAQLEHQAWSFLAGSGGGLAWEPDPVSRRLVLERGLLLPAWLLVPDSDSDGAEGVLLAGLSEFPPDYFPPNPNQPVPEPSAWLMLLGGGALVASVLRKSLRPAAA